MAAQNRRPPARRCTRRIGSARLGSARIGSDRIGSARLGSDQIGSVPSRPARPGRVWFVAAFRLRSDECPPARRHHAPHSASRLAQGGPALSRLVLNSDARRIINGTNNKSTGSARIDGRPAGRAWGLSRRAPSGHSSKRARKFIDSNPFQRRAILAARGEPVGRPAGRTRHSITSCAPL